jgi:peroxiredoxin
VAALAPGDPVPWLVVRRIGGGLFPFAAMAGKPVVITYLVSAAHPAAAQLVASFDAHGELFDAERALHLVVTCDPTDEREGRLAGRVHGRAVVFDHDLRLARALGLVRVAAGSELGLQATSFVLDADLRVVAAIPVTGVDHVDRVLPHVRPHDGVGDCVMSDIAPVLVLPRVFEPELSRALIRYYDEGVPDPSGVVVNRPDGTGQVVVDASRKVRHDMTIRDRQLGLAVRDRIERRIAPAMRKAFQFQVAHVERFVVACYLASDRGWFAPHRDNQGKMTAHRKFACSLNLDAEAYDGGDLWFPEFGARRYRAPSGGAVLFSCSLLHAVDPVTRGRRYCVLPFLYDEDGMRIRQSNHGPPGR